MNPLSLLGGGGGLAVSPSSSASTGPTSVGQEFAPSFFSPFAVGSGATATATAPLAGEKGGVGSLGDSTTILVVGALIAASLLGAALVLSRR